MPLTLLRLGPGYEKACLKWDFMYPEKYRNFVQHRLPQVGILTNIGTVHAERAGSQEMIARGKSELVQALPAAPEGTAILNMDDPWIVPMANSPKPRVFFYGLNPHADIWADEIVSQGLNGIRFHLHYQGETFATQAPVDWAAFHSYHSAGCGCRSR